MAAWFDLDVPLDLPEGAIAGAEADGRRLAVVRLGAEWRVFADTCTHAHCPFTEFGEVEDGALICNCHGAEFDLASGAVLEEPAEVPLVLLPAEVDGGRLRVRLG